MKFDGEILWDCGSIGIMVLPSGWKLRASQEGGPAMWTAHDFGPEDDPSVGITIYLPGIVAPAADGDLYRRAASRSIHWFDKDEFRGLAPLFRDLGDDDRFEISEIAREEVDGVSVLIVEGVWRESRTRNARLFVDRRGDGRLIQEIGVYGPWDYHPGYAQGVDLLRGIAWREESWKN